MKKLRNLQESSPNKNSEEKILEKFSVLSLLDIKIDEKESPELEITK